MNTGIFDTLAAARELEAAGFSREQAETEVKAMRDAASSSRTDLATRSRNALPALKCTACVAGLSTGAPVRGFLLNPPRRGRAEKAPKPRISMRPPPASYAARCASIILTAASTSPCESASLRFARRAMSCERITENIPSGSRPRPSRRVGYRGPRQLDAAQTGHPGTGPFSSSAAVRKPRR